VAKSRALRSSDPVTAHAAPEQHSVPAGVLFPLVEVVQVFGVTPGELLGAFGLEEQHFTEPQRRFSHSLYLAIIERARNLTGEPALGFLWGMQMRASVFGFLGYGAMMAATLRDAIQLAIEFAPLGSTAEGMRLHVEGDMASVVLEEYADFGRVRDVVMAARLTGLWRIAEALIGRPLGAIVDAAIPEPAYHARFARLVPEIRYGQPTTRAMLRTEVLGYPLVTADPVAQRLAAEQCKRELVALSAGGRLVRAVRDLLWKGDRSLRSPLEVAAAMHTSPRTLRRKLELQGSSLSTLIDDERRDRALLLLRSPELSVAQVAERLGYRNVQNFERAFRRWTDTTPAAYRRAKDLQ
jgi:AraC-like DNA-binding protein